MLFSNQRLQRRGLWLNPLVRLAIAIVICVGLPLVSQTWSLPKGWQEPEALNTAWAALGGLVIGFWLHRSVSELPGTQESSGILPGYLTSFGLALTVILLFRIDYSRSILVLSFVMTVAWFFLLYVVTQRRALLRLGVVTGGRIELFDDMVGVQPVRLTLDQWPNEIDAVAADFRYDHSDAWEARLADITLAGIPVHHSKDLYESLTGRADLEHLSENNFGSLGPLATLLGFKQVVDVLISIPALIVLAPIFLVSAIAIKLDSSGPVLFRQSRAGYRGQEFTVFKFRTMRALDERQAPREVDSFITQENDRRITRVGRFLRRTRIDELPQIVNILLGQMSWIGPRPEASKLSEWYQEEIPFYRYRHVVRPGITGWAQVNQGHVAEIADTRKKLQYDFYYIRNFSLWLDLLIIMKTVKTVFTGFGHK
ncbi:MAG TPA: exopolysaccharide biosynthesis polyprenyl glycosylphosphotransferase [Novosphingobium sp.]|nr:exopolysaccharide biosynthesis polyprenyl glycosylphosphotransferase [Novosphingobium sp.]